MTKSTRLFALANPCASPAAVHVIVPVVTVHAPVAVLFAGAVMFTRCRLVVGSVSMEMKFPSVYAAATVLVSDR